MAFGDLVELERSPPDAGDARLEVYWDLVKELRYSRAL